MKRGRFCVESKKKPGNKRGLFQPKTVWCSVQYVTDPLRLLWQTRPRNGRGGCGGGGSNCVACGAGNSIKGVISVKCRLVMQFLAERREKAFCRAASDELLVDTYATRTKHHTKMTLRRAAVIAFGSGSLCRRSREPIVYIMRHCKGRSVPWLLTTFSKFEPRYDYLDTSSGRRGGSYEQ